MDPINGLSMAKDWEDGLKQPGIFFGRSSESGELMNSRPHPKTDMESQFLEVCFKCFPFPEGVMFSFHVRRGVSTQCICIYTGG